MSKVRRNILYNLIGQLLLLLLGFASARYIYRGLGKDVLGILYFAITLNNVIAGILELGLGATAVKEIAANVESDDGYTRRLIRVGALYFWCGFGLVALVLVLSAPWIADGWLQIETLGRDDAVLMLQILSPAVFLAFPRTFYTSVFRGLQRMGTTNLIDVSVVAIQQLGVVALIQAGLNLYPVVLWIASVYALRVLVYQVILARTYSWRILLPLYDQAVVARNASFVRQMAGMSALGFIVAQGDKLVISKLLPVAHMGWYSFAYGVVCKGTQLTTAVTTAIFPRFSELVESGDREALLKTYHRTQSLLRQGLAPVFAALPFFVPSVFAQVLDAEAVAELWLPTTLLALGYYMQGTCVTPHFLALAQNRPDIGVRQTAYALFLVFPVTITLIAWLGLTGAAMGWVGYQLWAYAYGVRRVYSECLSLAPSQFYRQVGLSLLLMGGCYGGVFVGLWQTVGFAFPWAVLGYLAGTLLYTAMVWLVGGEYAREGLRTALAYVRRRP